MVETLDGILGGKMSRRDFLKLCGTAVATALLGCSGKSGSSGSSESFAPAPSEETKEVRPPELIYPKKGEIDDPHVKVGVPDDVYNMVKPLAEVVGFELPYHPVWFVEDEKKAEKYTKTSIKWVDRLMKNKNIISTYNKIISFLRPLMGEGFTDLYGDYITDAPEYPNLLIKYHVTIERGGGKVAGIIEIINKNDLNEYTFYFFDNFKQLDEFVMSCPTMHEVCKEYGVPWWKLPDAIIKRYGYPPEIIYINSLS